MRSTLRKTNTPRRRVRPKLLQIIRFMLSTLVRPLVLARRVPRQVMRGIEERDLNRCVATLVGEMSGAAQVLARRLKSCGVNKFRAWWDKAGGCRRTAGTRASGWVRSFTAACVTCGSRLCDVFREANSLADRKIAGLAYRLLRTLEKELTILCYRRRLG